jgi:glutamyl/glutaminyl-tRNA synthetase
MWTEWDDVRPIAGSRKSLSARLPPGPLTRFAPSPTGYLHLGHVANAVCVWGLARALGGRVLLRLEDHDRGRCRPEYEQAVLEDLEWLGLAADAGSPCRQSDRESVYLAELDRLASRWQVYACDCSRKEMALDGGDSPDIEIRYSGRCRDRGLSAGDGRGIRVRLDPGDERFVDGLLGEQIQEPSLQCGDLLLRDRLGNWTYQFAAVVDDFQQDVELVIRGEDLLGSTGRQLRLARMLGRREPPVFLHHPLIRKESGAKLSKAAGDTGVRELRAAGAAPSEVLGRAAWSIGLLAERRDVEAGDLATLFEEHGGR